MLCVKFSDDLENYSVIAAIPRIFKFHEVD